MPRISESSKDYYGAALIAGIGIAVLWAGLDYEVGSLNRMGSGFMPVVFGALLTIVGVAIAVTTHLSNPRASLVVVERHPFGQSEWRGWSCIVGGVAAFVILGQYGGLVPATFASIFIAAMGDRENTWTSAAVLAAGLTVFGTLVFHYGLRLQLPLFAWG